MYESMNRNIYTRKSQTGKKREILGFLSSMSRNYELYDVPKDSGRIYNKLGNTVPLRKWNGWREVVVLQIASVSRVSAIFPAESLLARVP